MECVSREQRSNIYLGKLYIIIIQNKILPSRANVYFRPLSGYFSPREWLLYVGERINLPVANFAPRLLLFSFFLC